MAAKPGKKKSKAISKKQMKKTKGGFGGAGGVSFNNAGLSGGTLQPQLPAIQGNLNTIGGSG